MKKFVFFLNPRQNRHIFLLSRLQLTGFVEKIQIDASTTLIISSSKGIPSIIAIKIQKPPKSMKTRLVALWGLLAAGTSFGAIGVVESTGQFSVNNSTVYLSPIPGSTSNPTLNNYDFGEFNPTTGDTLSLTNWYFENYAYNSGGTGTFDNNWINNGNTATLILSINSVSNNQALTYLSQTGNNHFWSNAPDSVNLLSGLSNGAYTLNVSVTYTFNQWDGSQTNVNTSNNNGVASATFTVIPEPSAVLLGGLGALALLHRRRF